MTIIRLYYRIEHRPADNRPTDRDQQEAIDTIETTQQGRRIERPLNGKGVNIRVNNGYITTIHTHYSMQPR